MNLSVKYSAEKTSGFESVFEYAYLRIYEFLYIVGLYFLRVIRTTYEYILNEIKYLLSNTKSSFEHIYKHIYTSARNFFLGKYHAMLTYKRSAESAVEILKSKDSLSSSKKSEAIITIIRCWGVFFLKILGTVLNYVAPIVAFVFLIFTIEYFSNLQYGLAYKVNGKTIAYIKDESVYSDAEQIIRNRTSKEIGDIGNIAPEYSIVPVSSLDLTESEELANIILSASNANVYEGYGLYIDDEFIGSTDEADNLLVLLDEYREQYREEGDTESRLQFVQKVSLIDGVYPTSSIMAISEFKTLLNTEVEGEKYYTVEAGDAPFSIASYYGISYKDLCNMNPGLENGDIHVGEQLVVSRSVSYLNVTNTRREVYNEDIPYTTNYTYSDKYYTTYSKVTKAGVPGEQRVTALVTYEDGVVVGRQVLTTEVLTEPIPREVTVGSKNIIYSVGNASGTSHGFVWPTIGGKVSCGFMGYKGHTGMDISGCGYGSNIYAAASGTVVTVKWSTKGYGYHVIINHGDGIQTLYGHCSNLYVKVGQYVNQGDIIAAMGSTGNSTGTHLHFEIRVNGQYVNPSKYVSK